MTKINKNFQNEKNIIDLNSELTNICKIIE